MFLRRFHKRISHIKNRIHALIWYVRKNRVVSFCLIYMLFNFLILNTLRNNFEGLVIGLVVSSLSLVVSYTISHILRTLSYETDVDNSICTKNVHPLSSLFLLFTNIFLVAFLCLARVAMFSRVEISSIDMVESFTREFSCYTVCIVDQPKIGNQMTTYHATILSDTSSLTPVTSGKILVQLPNFPRLGIGDTFQICGTISEPENFDDFDYKKFLMNRGVYGVLKNGSVEKFLNKNRTLKSILYNFKQNLVKKLERYMVEPQVSLLVGILFGENRPFSEDFEKSLRNSGTTHIVAASGYNVTILILLVGKCFSFLNKRLRDTLSHIAIWLFCIMSGLSASIIRASIMGSIAIVAQSQGRYQSIHRSFIIGIWLFTFFKPTIIYDVGFQLSILATIGLIYLSPSIEKYIEKKGKKLKDSFKEYTLTTMSCTLSTLPVSVSTFGTFSFVSILANTLILPVLESTMLWGFLGLIFSYISHSIAKFFLAVSFVQLKYFEIVVRKLGSLDFLVLTMEGESRIVVAVIVSLVLLVFVIGNFPIDNENYNYYFRLARGEND